MGIFFYRNKMKVIKKDCLGKRQPSLKPVKLAGYRRRAAIWFNNVRKCIVTRAAVLGEEKPVILRNESRTA